ncbi:hypothetical protein BIV57_18170 [Mangrovactinospora gilvigrisea]|uniref:Uncharacterized protein n=1 Tax=Mangrovactinospora gilvigrisea TaxID=1428644 RepID=A0A1J7BBS9_9ACTN|nr:hypothetical protein [Mangrovactinospora gilvigrisea]OIV36086.1 hypothetical protein BIV57_18170 [Mangrovactinospora gilvigrisea]
MYRDKGVNSATYLKPAAGPHHGRMVEQSSDEMVMDLIRAALQPRLEVVRQRGDVPACKVVAAAARNASDDGAQLHYLAHGIGLAGAMTLAVVAEHRGLGTDAFLVAMAQEDKLKPDPYPEVTELLGEFLKQDGSGKVGERLVELGRSNPERYLSVIVELADVTALLLRAMVGIGAAPSMDEALEDMAGMLHDWATE